MRFASCAKSIAALSFILCFLSAGDAHATSDELEHTSNSPGMISKVPAYALGYYGTVVAHETGHLLSALLFFSEIKSFKIYPHRTRNGWAMGSVDYHTKFKIAEPIVAMMGIGTTAIWAYVGAPMLPRTSNPFMRDVLTASLYSAAFDFPYYVLYDLAFSFGDIQTFSKSTGIPKFVLLIPAALTGYLLYNRVTAYRTGKTNETGFSNALSASRISIPNTGSSSEHDGLPSVLPELIFDPVKRIYGFAITNPF